jgi:hypothetical protein
MISYAFSDPTFEILRIVAESAGAPADWHRIAQQLDAREVFFAEHLIIVLQSIVERRLLVYERAVGSDTGCYRLTSAGAAYLEQTTQPAPGPVVMQPRSL